MEVTRGGEHLVSPYVVNAAHEVWSVLQKKREDIFRES